MSLKASVCGTLALIALWAGRLPAAESAPSQADLDFFNTKVQPLLKKSCYQCHSHDSGKIKGGLAVDSREGLLAGGDTGPALVPNDLARSLLISAVRYSSSDLQMPPKEKLPDADIAVFEEWVRRGAPDPRGSPAGVGNTEEIWKKAKTHWAFQPVTTPPLPRVREPDWVKTPVDAFILARLEARGLKPTPPADKRTLLRRATFDLTGLPPTPEEAHVFLADPSPQAYEKLIDRLLQSPHYGERWGRYWLDVARYADTTGESIVARRETRLIYAYTYRDYVIRAFNEDKPYDQFIIEQLAADRLPLGDDKGPLAALGFLTVGKRFLNSQDDVIDDRIDVVSRGLLGLTVACARCHDHKFDPIPTRDYYSWHGIFASCAEPKEEPLLAPVKPSAAYDDFVQQVREAEKAVAAFEDTEWNRVLSEAWQKFGDYLLAIHDHKQGSGGLSAQIFYRQRGLSPGIAARWAQYLRTLPRQGDPVFAPWFAFAKLAESEYATQGVQLAARFAANKERKPLNPLVAQLFAAGPPKSIQDIAQRYGRLFAHIDELYQQKRAELLKAAGHEGTPVEVALADPHQDALRLLLYGPNAPARRDLLVFQAEAGLRKQAHLAQLVSKVNDIKLTHPASPPCAMVLEDLPRPKNSHVYLRGDKLKPGPEVPRQFLEILAGPNRKPFTDGSGRLDLARAIADKDNPLTARVMVNRVWLNHFGQGLVTTPSDFGLRGEPPTHPQLLDYLARSFMDNGWSVKKLHRLILLSNTYRQATAPPSAKPPAADPGNQLLSRMNRRRLDLEALRDSILAVSGTLDRSLYGRPVSILANADRRTIYSTIDRLNLEGVFTTFDFALPDMSSPQRFETTVPTQALFLMNSPFVIEQAKQLAARPEFQKQVTDEERIRLLYQILFQRDPSAADIADGLAFLQAQRDRKPEPPRSPAWKYGTGSFKVKTGEVRFVESKRFVNDAWVVGEKSTPEKTNRIALTSRGGVTGALPTGGALRRWTAPIDAVVTIDGTLTHLPGKDGVGVLARVIRSHEGEPAHVVGRWEAKADKTATKMARVEVKKGDTLDFLVTPLGQVPEPFGWAPVIGLTDLRLAKQLDRRHQWNARADFTGPPEPAPKGLSPWEKYAQALLLTNEFVFVN